MKLRRRFTFAVGAAGAGHALRLFAQTPTPFAKRSRVLTQGVRANAQPYFETSTDEMGRACWQQGRSIADDWSSADGRQTLLRQRAEKLVARRPDVIYAGSQAGALAANDALHAEIAGGALVYARERLFERANRARLPNRRLGLTIPPSILVRADEVIE